MISTALSPHLVPIRTPNMLTCLLFPDGEGGIGVLDNQRGHNTYSQFSRIPTVSRRGEGGLVAHNFAENKYQQFSAGEN